MKLYEIKDCELELVREVDNMKTAEEVAIDVYNQEDREGDPMFFITSSGKQIQVCSETNVNVETIKL